MSTLRIPVHHVRGDADSKLQVQMAIALGLIWLLVWGLLGLWNLVRPPSLYFRKFTVVIEIVDPLTMDIPSAYFNPTVFCFLTLTASMSRMMNLGTLWLHSDLNCAVSTTLSASGKADVQNSGTTLPWHP
jgi:hypothetical protein